MSAAIHHAILKALKAGAPGLAEPVRNALAVSIGINLRAISEPGIRRDDLQKITTPAALRALGEIETALEAGVRAAKLALFVINKAGVMPNGSWKSGFDRDLATAEAGLAASRSHPPADRHAKDAADWCQRSLDAARATGDIDTRPFVQNAERIIRALRLLAGHPQAPASDRKLTADEAGSLRQAVIDSGELAYELKAQAPASGEGASSRARKLIEATEAVVTLSDQSPANRGKTLVAVRIDPAKVDFIGYCEALNEVLDAALLALSPSQPASGEGSLDYVPITGKGVDAINNREPEAMAAVSEQIKGMTFGKSTGAQRQPSGEGKLREALEAIARTTFSGSEMGEEYRRGNRDAHQTCARIAKVAIAASASAIEPTAAALPQEPHWRQYPPATKVMPALAFEGGSLQIKGQGYDSADGSGHFAFKDDDLGWADDHESLGYRVLRIERSELEAIRDHITESLGPYAPEAPVTFATPAAGIDPGTLDERQRIVIEWCARCFGDDHMADKIVRGARFFEEAAELVQAIGLPREHAMRAFDHVYSREPGDPAQEAGGVANTLMALCGALGLSFDDCQQAEIARCLAKDPAHFAERNKAKLKQVDAAP